MLLTHTSLNFTFHHEPQEADYYTPAGEFRIDKGGSKTLLNCLMYKMCFYRFGEVYTEHGAFTKWSF